MPPLPMPESTVLIIDNSASSRNADYFPSRLLSQLEAAEELITRKTQENSENQLGIITAAGKTPRTDVSLTTNKALLCSTLSGISPQGALSVSRTIQTAQLMLNHRKILTKEQRIVFFLGAATEEAAEELARLGEILCRNKISLDLILFGEAASQPEAFSSLAVSSEHSTSTAVVVPSTGGGALLSYLSANHPLFLGAAGLEDDQELALAIQLSLQESREREKQAAQ